MVISFFFKDKTTVICKTDYLIHVNDSTDSFTAKLCPLRAWCPQGESHWLFARPQETVCSLLLGRRWGSPCFPTTAGCFFRLAEGGYGFLRLLGLDWFVFLNRDTCLRKSPFPSEPGPSLPWEPRPWHRVFSSTDGLPDSSFWYAGWN